MAFEWNHYNEVFDARMNILEKITQHNSVFSKSERKVAEVILANPQTAIHSSIATLAKMSGVSEPTVNRFCRRLDTKGYPDFKLHLAQSLANGTPYVNRHVEENDGPEEYTHKIFESTMASLEVARQSVDIAVINRAVDLLTQAQKISFFGEKGEITITSKLSKFVTSAKISGSKNQVLLEEHNAMTQKFNGKQLDFIKEKFEAKKDEDADLLSKIEKTLAIRAQNR